MPTQPVQKYWISSQCAVLQELLFSNIFMLWQYWFDYACYACTRSRIALLYLTAQLYLTTWSVSANLPFIERLQWWCTDHACPDNRTLRTCAILCKMLFSIASFLVPAQQYFHLHNRHFWNIRWIASAQNTFSYINSTTYALLLK